MNRSMPPRRPATTTSQELTPKIEFSPPEFHGTRGSSILPEEVRHLVVVTGQRGTGKTTFCATAENPANVLFLDFESKGVSLLNQLPGLNYFAPLEECTRQYGLNYPRRAVWDRFLQIINAVPVGRFTTLVIDNGASLQDAAAAMVEDDPVSWGVKPAAVQSGSYGGPWPGVQRALQRLLTLIREKGFDLILVTFQPKASWVNGVPSMTRLQITNVTTWHEQSTLTIALDTSAIGKPGVPSAVVLKESSALIELNPETGEWQVQRRLPAQLPMATMAEIGRYLKHPADLLNPAPGEMPTVDAVDRWKTTFGRDQLAQFIRLMELAQAAAETTETTTTEEV